jgi:hypothetical protein
MRKWRRRASSTRCAPPHISGVSFKRICGLRVEGSGAGGNEEEYVHPNDDDLDNDLNAGDLAYLELPTDE